MALSTYPNNSKQIVLDDGTTYAYAYIQASKGKPTFLLLHGFPSASYDWHKQVKFLSGKGFGVLVPDLLGYGDTDCPTDVQSYSLKRMGDHIAEILGIEGLGDRGVIAVGHDWGSSFLSRIHSWHPEILKGLVFVDVGYRPPESLDLDASIQATEKAFGYPLQGYWKLFDQDDVGDIISKHTDSFTSLVYPEDPETWRTHLCPIGAAEAWITSDKVTPLPKWLSEEEAATHKKIMAQKGYTGPTNWYKQLIRGVDAVAVSNLPEERKYINLPTMLVTAKKDPVGLARVMIDNTSKWAKHLQVEELDCGHWVQLEQPEKLNQLLERFALEHP